MCGCVGMMNIFAVPSLQGIHYGRVPLNPNMGFGIKVTRVQSHQHHRIGSVNNPIRINGTTETSIFLKFVTLSNLKLDNTYKQSNLKLDNTYKQLKLLSSFRFSGVESLFLT